MSHRTPLAPDLMYIECMHDNVFRITPLVDRSHLSGMYAALHKHLIGRDLCME